MLLCPAVRYPTQAWRDVADPAVRSLYDGLAARLTPPAEPSLGYLYHFAALYVQMWR